MDVHKSRWKKDKVKLKDWYMVCHKPGKHQTFKYAETLRPLLIKRTNTLCPSALLLRKGECSFLSASYLNQANRETHINGHWNQSVLSGHQIWHFFWNNNACGARNTSIFSGKRSSLSKNSSGKLCRWSFILRQQNWPDRMKDNEIPAFWSKVNRLVF